MSTENYLIRLLQNRFRNAVIEQQITLFNVVDAASGVVLDTTVDCAFLAFILDNDSSLIVDNDNNILLDSVQLKNYLAQRMYYYNPRILDSIVFALAPVQFWVDAQDKSELTSYNSSGRLEYITCKVTDPTDPRNTYAADPSYAITYRYSLLNGYAFSRLANDLPAAEWTITSAMNLKPYSTKTACTIAFVVSNVWDTTNNILMWFGNPATDNWTKITAYPSGSDLRIEIVMSKSGETPITWTETYTDIAANLNRVVITCDGTNYYLYVNNEDARTQALPAWSATFGQYKYLFSPTSIGKSYSGNLYDLIMFSAYFEAASVETLMSYFSTKYFMAI